MNEEITYSVKEAAIKLGRSLNTIRRLISEGKLEATKHSHKEGYRISQESLELYAKKLEPHIGTLWNKSSRDSPEFDQIIGKLLSGKLSYDDDNRELSVMIAEAYDVLKKVRETLESELQSLELEIQYLQNDSKRADKDELLYNKQTRQSVISWNLHVVDIVKAKLTHDSSSK